MAGKTAWFHLHILGSGPGRMRQGCFDFLLRLGTSVVSAVLVAVGALLLVIGLLSSSPLSGVRTALSIIAALIAAYLFIQVGRAIWRDLRKPQEPDHEEPDDKAPADDR
ncbi:hypothetical protein BH24ACT21_BH24ACT21_07700 [soil metagenome]|jgi:hypothetical protein